MEDVYKYQTDRELWTQFRAGDEQVFAYLYSHYVVMLYHYANRITSHQNLIEDCIQDLFVELWKNRATLGETDSIKYYLYKSLKRALIRALVNLRKRHKGADLPEEYDFEIVLSPEFDLIARQVSQEQKDKLLIALNELTPRQKEAITLKFYDGLTYQEVASLLSMSVRAAYNLVYRAIDVLRTHLEKVVLLLLLGL